MNNLGEFILKERTKRNMGLRTFADKCGLSHTYIDSIEKGKDFRTGKKVNISVDTLIKIALYLNVKTELLLKLCYSDYFEINISPDFSPLPPVLSESEQELLGYFRACDTGEQGKILGYAEFAANKHNDIKEEVLKFGK